MKLGVAYYPEHWPEERWPEDIRLMKEANINVVRLADFAWSRLEPEEGKYNFEWLDRVIALFDQKGLKVILCTPTAAPPAWLIQKHPEILPADPRKYRLEFGTRMHRCLSNPDMRRYSRTITGEMVRHYRNNPAVIAWQLDNELEGNLCYCPICAGKFREWLAQKYGTLENLNRSWGTVFWSQEYTDWEQIPLPWESKCGRAHNPSLQLDYSRFASDTTLSFLKEQKEIIRKFAPDCIITHDFRSPQDDLDYAKAAAELDLVSYNNYPLFGREHDPGLTHDFHYGLKQKPFWIMEEQAGITGWEIMHRNPDPGQIRFWAWQAIAHGAALVNFFRWRSCRFGTEQFWHGILDHGGRVTRRYHEISRLGQELAELGEMVDNTRPSRKVAIVNSFEEDCSLKIQPQVPSDGFNCWSQIRKIYNAFEELGVETDIIPVDADWAPYRLLVFPSWYLASKELALRVEIFVSSGGRAVFLPRSGVKDMNNICQTDPLPGVLARVLGIEIEDYEPLSADMVNTIHLVWGGEFENNTWAEIVHSSGASIIGEHGKRYYAGSPALTCNRFGSGKAYYLGCLPEERFYPAFFGEILSELNMTTDSKLPAGVKVKTRIAKDYKLYFIYNLSDTLKLLQPRFGKNIEILLGKEFIQKTGGLETVWQIPPYEIIIGREETDNIV